MSKNRFDSCLKQLIDSGRLNEIQDVEQLRNLVIKEIEDSRCYEPDARRMVLTLRSPEMSTTLNIQKYVFDCYLRYTGLGVVGRRRFSV